MTSCLLRNIGRRAAAAAVFAFALLGAGCASLPPEASIKRESSSAILASPDTALGRIAADSLPAPGLTGFRLLPIGSFAFDTRVTLARRAEVSLDVQYYLLQNDDTGRYLMRMLRDAANRGVRVRLLIDDFYTTGEDDLLNGLAAHPNIEIRLFNPFPTRGGIISRFAASIFDFGRLNHRMHNKLFIADGAFAVAGGRNIANEYFMRDGVSNFVDLDTLITGALVPQLQFLFDYYWASPYVYPLHVVAPPGADAATLRAEFETATAEPLTSPPPKPPDNDVLGYGPVADELDDGRIGLVWAEAEAYADPPDKIADMMEGGKKRERYLDEEAVRFNVLERLKAAQTEVVMTSPYLIPGAKGMEVFRGLRARDVKVKILTNSLASTDEPLVYTAYRRYRPEMLRLGMELHELSPTRVKRNLRLGMFGTTHGRLHAKTAVIDRKQVFIGSMNFDPRSEIHNTEMGIFVDSPQLAREMLRLMDLDKLQASYRLRLAPGGGDKVQWLAFNDDGDEMVQDDEPDTDGWSLFWLNLLAPLAPEQLL
jgi:cardiolipin synthase C